MGLNYNPSEKVEGSGRAKAGEYDFRTEVVRETTFRSGSEGLEVQLMVAAFPDRDIKVFDRLVFVPKALWRVEEFMNGLGFDFGNPPDAHVLEGRIGRAKFRVGENGYLEVAEYLPAKVKQFGQGAPAPQQQRQQQRAPADDKLPF